MPAVAKKKSCSLSVSLPYLWLPILIAGPNGEQLNLSKVIQEALLMYAKKRGIKLPE